VNMVFLFRGKKLPFHRSQFSRRYQLSL
jgi:hypothetical protein